MFLKIFLSTILIFCIGFIIFLLNPPDDYIKIEQITYFKENEFKTPKTGIQKPYSFYEWGSEKFEKNKTTLLASVFNLNKKENYFCDIFGSKKVDNYICNLAKERGYREREIANKKDLISIQNHKIYKESLKDFKMMQSEAMEYGMNLILISAYRSIEDQRNIFLNKFDNKYSNKEILKGKADDFINNILDYSSIPGYSKHHSGKAVDLGCNNRIMINSVFEKSNCYDWLSKDNFRNAKKYNFYPSYPPSPISSGPKPESWEFVWK